MSSTQMVDSLETMSKDMVDAHFPEKSVTIGQTDLPYFTEQLRTLKRNRLRAYTRFGRRSIQYLNSKEAFEKKLIIEAKNY